MVKSSLKLFMTKQETFGHLFLVNNNLGRYRMIRFDFSMLGSDSSKKLEKIILQNEYTYPDILKITGEFQIVINGNIFFSEPYFPVLEFLKDALAWINCSDKSKEMLYSSIETENNPLIVFLKKGDEWIIRSPWQKYECKVTFTRGEVSGAILHLINHLINN